MDAVFFEGIGAVVSGIIVFCGSVFLLLAIVMGARLAYFVTASVTLGFLLIMGVVWGFGDKDLQPDNPLGPVGVLPSYDAVGIARDPSAIDFNAATEYPDAPWVEPDPDDAAEQTKASDASNAAIDALEEALMEGEDLDYTVASDAQANSDDVRFLEQGEDEYAAVPITPLEGEEGAELLAVLKYDPGDPLGPARQITLGIGVLFVGHLWGLARIERRARRETVEGTAT